MIDSDTLINLEFDQVLQLISAYASSAVTIGKINEITPLTELKSIKTRLNEVAEIRLLSTQNTPLRIERFEDIFEILEQIRPEDAIVDIKELLDIKTVLSALGGVYSQLRHKSDLPHLFRIAQQTIGFPDILSRLNRTITRDGAISDNASPELRQIRDDIKNMRSRISRRLEEIVKHPSVTPFLQDDFITTRAGRWVIPVRMDSKGQVPGVMRDISNTGETAFTEPLEIIGLTNDHQNLLARERVEMIRIIRKICNQLRSVLDELKSQFKSLIYIDMQKSVAAFADTLDMNPVYVNSAAQLSLYNARHPLLLTQQRSAKLDNVEALNLNVEDQIRAVVLSGPNAGGKTIAIKTVGLLLVMAHCGFPIPADEISTLPFIHTLLVDIGDEQSIGNSLSTFSAHISKISEIIKNADAMTVALMDELGAGTDPKEGAAIANAVLNALSDKGALTLATTHLTDIISYVYRSEVMMNASMEYDQETLSPLYRLKVGEPGLSHALDVAQQYGLPPDIIDNARRFIHHGDFEFNQLLKDLKRQRLKYEDLTSELTKRENQLAQREAQIRQKLEHIENAKKAAQKDALRQAKEIINTTKRQAVALLDQFKKEKKETDYKAIEAQRIIIEEKLEALEDDNERLKPVSVKEIQTGAYYYIKSLGCDGKIIKIDKKRKRVTAVCAGKSIDIMINDLRQKKTDHTKKHKEQMNISYPEDDISSSLKLIGLRVEAALSALDAYLDKVSVNGPNEIRIIHGVGTGALIKAIREHIKDHPFIKGFRRANPSEGGDGVTIISMK